MQCEDCGNVFHPTRLFQFFCPSCEYQAEVDRRALALAAAEVAKVQANLEAERSRVREMSDGQMALIAL